MRLSFHLFIHFFMCLIIGFLGSVILSIPFLYSFIASLIGGFLIDLDHLIDYFLAFGFQHKLNYFLKGYQFLKSDKSYVLFHSFELSIFLILLAFILHYYLLLIIATSLFLHLITDLSINKLSLKFYFLIYRLINNFDLKFIDTADAYKTHRRQKKKTSMDH